MYWAAWSVDDAMVLDILGSSPEKLLLTLGEGRNSTGEDDGSDLGESNRVVKVLIVNEPLIGKVTATILNEGLVDWQDVLHSALVRYVVVSSFVSSLVSQLNRYREPSLPNFWVLGVSAIEICINSGKNLVIQVADAGQQFVQEDDL